MNASVATTNHDLKTQLQRAMDTLGVDLIFALSPQAKGRVERLFKTLQDRLVRSCALRRSPRSTRRTDSSPHASFRHSTGDTRLHPARRRTSTGRSPSATRHSFPRRSAASSLGRSSGISPCPSRAAGIRSCRPPRHPTERRGDGPAVRRWHDLLHDSEQACGHEARREAAYIRRTRHFVPTLTAA